MSSVAILAQVEVEGSIALAYAARSVFGQLSFGMAPKAKGKAKGKGKGKAKTKARLAAAAAAAATAAAVGPDGVAVALAPGEAAEVTTGAEGEGGENLVGGGAIVPVAKAKSKGLSAIKKKVFESLGEKSIEDVIAAAKAKLQKEEAMMEEVSALESSHEKQVEEAQTEFEKVKVEVAAAMEKEQEAAKTWAEMKKKKSDALGTVNAKRAELLEAQKKRAMLEVTALNHARRQELEAKKIAAMEAAAAAKANLLEQKQKQKEALEATRAALANVKAASGKGVKRAAEEEPVEASPAKQVAAQDVE